MQRQADCTRRLVISLAGTVLARGFPVAGFLIALLLGTPSLAQHAMHAMPGAGQVLMSSMPGDNAVLEASPETLMLQFGTEVQLVKLAVKNPAAGKEPIDIGFRYRPEAGMHFMQSLPELEAADYYAVEWAAFDSRHNLLKGVFYFSFGKDARPPSFYRDQLERMQHIMSPDYRLL